jgi:heptosyltransferase-3
MNSRFSDAVERLPVSARVVIVRAGALGDTILLLPAVALIRQRLPHATITIIGSHWARELASLMPCPWDFLPFDSQAMAKLFVPGAHADPVGILSSADLLLVYTDESDSHFVRNLKRLCRGQLRLLSARPPPGTHAACHLASAVSDSTPNVERLPLPVLRAPTPTVETVRRWFAQRLGESSQKLFVIHPGSGGARKCWPAGHFAVVAASVARAHAAVAMLKGPADEAACSAVLQSIPSDAAIMVAEFADLQAVAGLLQQAAAYLGNDSGISHLAAALGTPSVVVFGSTDPTTWRPLGRAVHVVAGASPTAASTWPRAEEVLDAVRAALGV